MTKYIIVAGGVISGVGKGVATASIGRIMKEYGFSVTAIKIDPYINCDAGTLRPTEHGEVWVTDDGGEIDQDLGNYERFLDQPIPKKNNITTGQIYQKLITKERNGDFLGETVEVIPHVPEEIKKRIIDASEGFDICLIEIGGTVGEYQHSIFLFAIRSLENDIGKENICYNLVSYMPIPSHIEEMKTKPTQLAINLLRQSGIEPDFVLCRGKNALDDIRKKKLGRNINIQPDHVISMPDVVGVGKPNSLYIIPIDLQKELLGEKILKILHLKKKKEAEFLEWNKSLEGIFNPNKTINIAMVGKYLDIGDYTLTDSYISVNEALKHAAAVNNVIIKISWINAKDFEKDSKSIEKLKEYGGIIVPGGFGNSGVEGKILAIKYARENDLPFLGLCLGMQLAVIDFARNVCNLSGANSTEMDTKTKYPVIDMLEEQKKILYENRYGASMRLGAYPANLKKDTQVWKLYNQKDVVEERHRHRYEVNPEYISLLEEKGLVFSGVSPDRKLMEFMELPINKFHVATQAHPEFTSRFGKPNPLFDGFVKSML
jgi:CTP synthase